MRAISAGSVKYYLDLLRGLCDSFINSSGLIRASPFNKLGYPMV